MKLSPLITHVVVVIGVSSIALWQVPPQPKAPATTAVSALLDELESECDLRSPGNDYQFYPVPPTEARRHRLISHLQTTGPAALTEIRVRRQQTTNVEYAEMLLIASAAAGDKASFAAACRLMVWSPSPAVRMSAVRLLRQFRDPRGAEWLQTAALNDDRFVLSCGCGAPRERYYPVRTVAEIALAELAAVPSAIGR